MIRSHFDLEVFGTTASELIRSLEEECFRFEQEILRLQTNWHLQRTLGGWSPAQITEHIILSNQSMAKLLKVFSWISWFPIPAKAGQRSPEGKAISMPRLRPRAGQDWAVLKPQWEAAQNELKKIYSSVNLQNTRTFPHQTRGQLNALEWSQVVIFHIRHHRFQLEECKSEHPYPSLP